MRVVIVVAAAMPVLGITLALVTDNPAWLWLGVFIVFFLT